MLPSADQLFKDFILKISNDFIFQQDLAPALTAKSDHGVGVLDWPANSPDLNFNL